MEADWAFDIADEADVIDAHWHGLIDLRAHPELAHTLPEAVNLPALAEALIQLNHPCSALWTAKCDVWVEGAVDPDELDAPAHAAANSLACYIDLLPRDPACWPTPDVVADGCRRLRTTLQAQPLRRCRADLVIRAACIGPGNFGFGVTAYLIGCGASSADAADALSTALGALAETAVALGNVSKYNE